MKTIAPSDRRLFQLTAGALLVLLAIAVVPKTVALADPSRAGRDRYVFGDMDFVADNVGDLHPVMTWALVTPEEDIEDVGVTIPVALFDNQPTAGGDGPAGAITSLVFPEVVQDFTYLHHV